MPTLALERAYIGVSVQPSRLSSIHIQLRSRRFRPTQPFHVVIDGTHRQQSLTITLEQGDEARLEAFWPCLDDLDDIEV